MSLQKFTSDLRYLIAKGKPEEALEKLLNVYRNLSGKYHDEVIVLSSQFNDIKEEQMAGIIDPDDAQRKINQVNHSLLQVIENLDNDPAIARHFGVKVKEDDIPQKEGGLGKILPWILVGLLLAALAYFVLPQFSGGEKTVETSVEEVAENDSNVLPQIEEKTKTPVSENRKNRNKVAITDTEKEPNNSRFEPNEIQYNSVIEGTIQDAEDKDCFVFKSSDGYRNVFNLRVENLSDKFRPHIQVFDGNRKKIGDQYETTAGAHLDFQLVANNSETYYVMLKNYGRLDAPERYELRLELEKYDTDALIEVEPNNSISEAQSLPIGKDMAGFAPHQKTDDYFLVEPGQSGELMARVSTVSEKFRPQVYWYDENKRQLSNVYEITHGANTEAPVTVTKGKKYYLRIKQYGSGFGDYLINVDYN